MRKALFALCLVPAGVALTVASDAKPPTPESEMIYRPGCFVDEVEEEAMMLHSAPAPMRRSPRSRSMPSPAPAPSPSAPPAASSAPAGGSGVGGGGSASGLGGLGTKGMGSGASGYGSGGGSFSQKKKTPHLMDMDDVVASGRSGSASLDFGGTTWLSNDDSMSLASAQRLLWALKSGRSFTPGQIRPHELLNYFSFDTVTPDDDQMFDVQVSAVREGEEGLNVAFAVKGAAPAPAPLDLTLIVDRSCSMQDAGRMDYTKRGLTKMTEQLDEGDRLDVVLFDDGVCTPLENFVVGRDDPQILNDVIQRMEPRGSTDMNRGLKEGYAVAARKTDAHARNRRVMVLTDAMLNTGDVNPNTVSEIGKAFEDEGIRLTGVGVGRDFNDTVLDKLTEKGKGAYVFLGSEAVVDRVFGVGFPSLVQTLAHDVQFELELPDSLALERFYGEESSSTRTDIQPINYYAGTSQVFLQDLKVAPGGIVPQDTVTFTAHYRHATTGEPMERAFHVRVGDMLDSDPRNVHKARALMAFSDVLVEKATQRRCDGTVLGTYRDRASLVGDDAEIAYVTGLIEQTCGTPLASVRPEAPRVDYKVKIDADIPIAEVGLACAGWSGSKSLTASDSVARFTAPAERCTLSLHGAVAMTQAVEVPSTGGDLRCLVRGGRMTCN